MVSPPPIQLANLGMADSFILMVLALVVFGPRRLPQIGRQIGKLMYEFRKASNDFKFQMEEELRVAEEADRRKKEEEERQRMAALTAASQASVSAPPQTVEAQADIGAVEPATASQPNPPETGPPESSPPETGSATPEPPSDAPMIQPPRTGLPVSALSPAERPDDFLDPSPGTPPEPAAITAVNPDADVAANAEALSPEAAAGAACPPANGSGSSLHNSSSTPAKEPVSQHG